VPTLSLCLLFAVVVVIHIVITGNKGRGKEALPPMRERPDEYCKKFFVANVSFEAQDEDVIAFFAQAGAAAPEKVSVLCVLL
jgi:hypothetical protein